MCRWIDIVQSRLYAGVNPENHFAFPCRRYAYLGHLRECDCVRFYKESCGTKYPEPIQPTKLRKQIATVSQLLNLRKNELDILSDFLGYDVNSTSGMLYDAPGNFTGDKSVKSTRGHGKGCVLRTTWGVFGRD